MVLAYYAARPPKPLVLDNPDPTIRPASKRPGPDAGLQLQQPGHLYRRCRNAAASKGGTGRLSRWMT